MCVSKLRPRRCPKKKIYIFNYSYCAVYTLYIIFFSPVVSIAPCFSPTSTVHNTVGQQADEDGNDEKVDAKIEAKRLRKSERKEQKRLHAKEQR